MKRSEILRSLLIFGVLLVITGCGKETSTSSSGPLRIGLDPTYPPFEMRTPDGALSGVSVDLGKEIGKRMNREVEFIAMDFQGLLPSLQTGKIDIILSSMTATEERAKQVAFSDPYVENGLSMLVPATSTIKDHNELDQAGRTVVVRTGTTGHIYAVKNIKSAKVIPQELTESCANEVINGNVDAFIYDQLSVLEYAARNPEKLKAIAKPFQKENWALALRKEDDALLTGINGVLKTLRQEKWLAQSFDKYPVLKERRDQLAAQGLPMFFVME